MFGAVLDAAFLSLGENRDNHTPNSPKLILSVKSHTCGACSACNGKSARLLWKKKRHCRDYSKEFGAWLSLSPPREKKNFFLDASSVLANANVASERLVGSEHNSNNSNAEPLARFSELLRALATHSLAGVVAGVCLDPACESHERVRRKAICSHS